MVATSVRLVTVVVQEAAVQGRVQAAWEMLTSAMQVGAATTVERVHPAVVEVVEVQPVPTERQMLAVRVVLARLR